LILKKAILLAAAVAALAAAAAVCVVALAFGLYAALSPHLGPAWAAAAVAGAAALVLALGASAAMLNAAPRRKDEAKDLIARAFDLAREKPMIAGAAIIAAAVVALRNPKITAALVGAFLAGRPAKK